MSWEVVVRRLRGEGGRSIRDQISPYDSAAWLCPQSALNRASIAAKARPVFYASRDAFAFLRLGVFYWIVVRHAFAEDNAVLPTNFRIKAQTSERAGRNFGEELRTHRAGEHTPYWIRVLDSEAARPLRHRE